MKHLSSLFAISFALVASQAAWAQTDFKGLYVQWETGYQHNIISGSSPKLLSAGNLYDGTKTGAATSNGVPLFVNFGYSFKVSPRWRLGTGVEHEFIDSNTHALNSNFAGQGGYGNVSYYDQVSDETNFFLAPGYVLSDGKMVFFKAGYSFESVSINGVDSKAKTSGGYVVGIGYKQMVTRRLYITAEAHYSEYGKLSPSGAFGSNATLTGTTGNLGALDITVGVGLKIRK